MRVPPHDAASRPSEWRELGRSIVYECGKLGECPPSAATTLSPIDLHPLPKNAVLSWALVYDDALDEERMRKALARVLQDYPLLAGRFAPNKQRRGRGGWFGLAPKPTPARINHRAVFDAREAYVTTIPATGGGGGADGDPMRVLHNNVGVPFTIGRASCRASDLAASGFVVTHAQAPWLVDAMDLRRVFEGRDAVMSVRLTHLRNGGGAIGVTVPHALTDGRALTAFLTALSRSYEGLPFPAPSLDRGVVAFQTLASRCSPKERASLLSPNSDAPASQDGKLSVLARAASFLGAYNRGPPAAAPQNASADHGSPHLPHSQPPRPPSSPPDVASDVTLWQAVRFLSGVGWAAWTRGQRLARPLVLHVDEGRLRRTQGDATPQRVSRNDCAVAHVWRLLRTLQDRLGLLRGTDREHASRMLFAADLRVAGRLLEAPVGEGYFGNAVVAVDVRGPGRMTHPECAMEVRRAVTNGLAPSRTMALLRSIWQLSGGGASLGQSVRALVASLPCYHDCFVTSWPFAFDDVAFGDRRPIAFLPGMFPACPWTAIVIGGKGEGAGKHVHLTLPEDAIALLKDDPALEGGLGTLGTLAGVTHDEQQA